MILIEGQTLPFFTIYSFIYVNMPVSFSFKAIFYEIVVFNRGIAYKFTEQLNIRSTTGISETGKIPEAKL